MRLSINIENYPIFREVYCTFVTPSVTLGFVILSFRHKGLENLFVKGSAKVFRPDAAKKLRIRLDILNRARSPLDMQLPGFRWHELKGDRQGTYAVDVTENYRLTFRFEGQNATDVDYEDYH